MEAHRAAVPRPPPPHPVFAMRPLPFRPAVLCGFAVVVATAAAVGGEGEESVAPALTPESATHFEDAIRPVLAETCGDCHAADDPDNHVGFLTAATADDLNADRGLWKNVAEQLRNRTMPPGRFLLPADRDAAPRGRRLGGRVPPPDRLRRRAARRAGRGPAAEPARVRQHAPRSAGRRSAPGRRVPRGRGRRGGVRQQRRDPVHLADPVRTVSDRHDHGPRRGGLDAAAGGRVRPGGPAPAGRTGPSAGCERFRPAGRSRRRCRSICPGTTRSA